MYMFQFYTITIHNNCSVNNGTLVNFCKNQQMQFTRNLSKDILIEIFYLKCYYFS